MEKRWYFSSFWVLQFHMHSSSNSMSQLIYGTWISQLITLRAWIIPINTYFSLWLSNLDLSWSSTGTYAMLLNKLKWEIVLFFQLQACYVGFFLIQSLGETIIGQIDCMSRFMPNFFENSHALPLSTIYVGIWLTPSFKYSN